MDHTKKETTLFRVDSTTAEAIELGLFDHTGLHEIRRVPMLRGDSGAWTVEVPEVRAGQLYGFRAYGAWEPRRGQTFNPHKLLLDPRAKAIAGGMTWDDAVHGQRVGPGGLWQADERDSAPFVPKSVVVDEAFDWGNDRPPRTPWTDTLIYECHVKGTTMLHPDVPAPDRGRYLGLSSPAMLDHLCSLGVTAVELLPVQHALTRRWLIERGLTNYWGYDPIGFFAPDARFASGDRGHQVGEFKRMVQAFHARGIEVILDVVFNHTVEGDEAGPTLSMRGLDHAAYYRLDADGRCLNFTGCGNTLNTDHPAVRRLILDALRYWVEHMHVDGFRFDLASALARGEGGFDSGHPLLAEIQADPVLASVKLIAEPWDAQADGYALGRFPRGWSEWNDRFRDTVRRYWRGDAGQTAGLAYALTGSSDALGTKGSPLTGINYVACHDGFTLHDLTSYEHRRNANNGEEGRDGQQDNASCNWGVEGPTSDRRVIRRRERAQRNMLATVAFSLGVPMLRAGDELGQTQQGNNNAYCQDNETTWLAWPKIITPPNPPPSQGGAGGGFCQEPGTETGLLAFTRRLFALRRSLALFRAPTFLTGQVHCPCGLKDVTWLRCDGGEMSPEDWHQADLGAFGMLRHHHADATAHGQTVLLLFNPRPRVVTFCAPSREGRGWWVCLISAGFSTLPGGSGVDRFRVRPFSILLLKWQRPAAAG